MLNEKNEMAYKKIWGLKKLEEMGFPVPPYVVIDLAHNKAVPEMEEYIREEIKQIGIPNLKGDRVGVTIRISVPYGLDKVAKHGGLHVTDLEEVIRRVLEKYEQYGPHCKIIIQHTVDARCSGTILKENNHAVIEAIIGDAPPLLEGEVSDYERWIFNGRIWMKEKEYLIDAKKVQILSLKNIQTLQRYINMVPSSAYLEWSISKKGKLYFYEFYKLKNQQ